MRDYRSAITVRLPAWIEEVCRGLADQPLLSDEARMEWVIGLSRQNVEQGTGGPFAAAVFDEAGRLIAPGVNLVVPCRCSTAHAEIVALSFAQQTLGSHDLGATGCPRCALVSSTEPCAMCLGAMPWSGVRRLVCGARDEDARRIGMDEGDKPDGWPDSLRRRGIDVRRDVLRSRAAEILDRYACEGGEIYNGRSGDAETR